MFKNTTLSAVLFALATALTGCEEMVVEGSFPVGEFHGLEVGFQTREAASDVSLDCELRDNDFGCLPEIYRVSSDQFRFRLNEAYVSPDERVYLWGTYTDMGGTPRDLFCRDNPEVLYVEAAYNGWPIEVDLTSDCELRLDMDDLL